MPPSTRFHLRAVLDEVPLSVLPAVATELEEDDGARGEVRDGVSRGTCTRRHDATSLQVTVPGATPDHAACNSARTPSKLRGAGFG